MQVSKKRVGRAIVTLCMVVIASLAYAQATSTFNGRVLDQGDAVLPGVTVTATNNATGVVRTTVTNAEGSYYMPGLEPGVYEVKTDLTGFAPSARQNVTLAINATLTIDFKLALAGLNETLTVTGEAPMIEVTQSKVANTHPDDGAAESPDDHAHDQRDAGAAAGRRAGRRAPPDQAERRDGVLRGFLRGATWHRPSTAPTTATTTTADR